MEHKESITSPKVNMCITEITSTLNQRGTFYCIKTFMTDALMCLLIVVQVEYE